MLKIQKVKKDTSDYQSLYDSSRWRGRLCKQLSIIFTRLILFVCFCAHTPGNTWKFALHFVSSFNNKVLSHALQRIRSRVSPYLPAFAFGVFVNWWQSGWFEQEVGRGWSTCTEPNSSSPPGSVGLFQCQKISDCFVSPLGRHVDVFFYWCTSDPHCCILGFWIQ